MTKLCDNKAIIAIENYNIENNAWGTSDPSPPQCITGPPEELIGWNWDWPGQNAAKIMGYPEIIFGKKPFNQGTTTPTLPCSLSSFRTLSVDLNFQISATGAYNAAFDLWLTNSSVASEASITSEIMIWLFSRGLTPAGDKVTAIKSSTGSSRFYTGKMQWWNYFAFVLDHELKSGTVDLKPFLDYLVTESLVPSDNYLASVEFGTEIAYGRGNVTVNSYAVSIS